MLICKIILLSIIPTVASYDPCSNYKSLNAADRLESFTSQNSVRCDQKDITPGWYRFTGVAGNPKMPTSCPPVSRCGTHAPGWIKGQHPSVADGEVTREVCYHWTNNCCRWRNNIKVKNCGAFYVYELQKTPVCWLRYCGECWRSYTTWHNSSYRSYQLFEMQTNRRVNSQLCIDPFASFLCFSKRREYLTAGSAPITAFGQKTLKREITVVRNDLECM